MYSNLSMNKQKSDESEHGLQAKRTRRSLFLVKAYDMVDRADINDIICWNKEGNGFIVRDVERLCDEVLPNYFKHSNFASFVKQLNIYKFEKAIGKST